MPRLPKPPTQSSLIQTTALVGLQCTSNYATANVLNSTEINSRPVHRILGGYEIRWMSCLAAVVCQRLQPSTLRSSSSSSSTRWPRWNRVRKTPRLLRSVARSRAAVSLRRFAALALDDVVSAVHRLPDKSSCCWSAPHFVTETSSRHYSSIYFSAFEQVAGRGAFSSCFQRGFHNTNNEEARTQWYGRLFL